MVFRLHLVGQEIEMKKHCRGEHNGRLVVLCLVPCLKILERRIDGYGEERIEWRRWGMWSILWHFFSEMQRLGEFIFAIGETIFHPYPSQEKKMRKPFKHSIEHSFYWLIVLYSADGSLIGLLYFISNASCFFIMLTEPRTQKIWLFFFLMVYGELWKLWLFIWVLFLSQLW